MEGSTIVLDKKGGIPVFLIKIGGQPQYSVLYRIGGLSVYCNIQSL